MDEHKGALYPVGAFFGKLLDKLSPSKTKESLENNAEEHSEVYYESQFGLPQTQDLSAPNEDHFYEEFGIPEFHSNESLNESTLGSNIGSTDESSYEPNDFEPLHINVDGSLMLNGIHGTDIHGHLFGETDKFSTEDFSSSSCSDDFI